MDVTDKLISNDLELNGQIGRSLHSGQDFAYWLAQLGPWVDERPQMEKMAAPSAANEASDSFYRQAPLAATSEDFPKIAIQSQLLHQQDLTALMLWQSMHPDPLSLNNDALKIDEEVIENCELHVRQRLKQIPVNQITPDPTLLDAIIPVERDMLLAN